MTESGSSVVQGLLLLDHDNIPFGTVHLRQILDCWLGGLASEAIPCGVMSVTIRAYGGWYRQSDTSDARFKASEYYQNECPSLVKVAGRYCRIQFEFADKLLPPPQLTKTPMALGITHTVAVRASAETVVARSGALPCSEPGCQLKPVKKWIKKKRACTKEACPLEFKDQFERHQQKQVDVHLAADILTWAYTWEQSCHLAVASDDIDMLPALAAAALFRQGQQRATLIRFFTSNAYLDGALLDLGVRLEKV